MATPPSWWHLAALTILALVAVAVITSWITRARQATDNPYESDPGDLADDLYRSEQDGALG